MQQHLWFHWKTKHWRRLLTIVAALGIMAVSSHGRTEDLAVSRFAVDGLGGWTSKSFKGNTEYRVVSEEGRKVVRAESHAAASGLIRQMPFNPAKYRYLQWSWKIDHTIKGGNEKTKAGDDYAARVYVVFPGRFFWQTKAINYIWANTLPKGESIPNAFASGAMMLAVESGPSQAGRWISEKRDILADYQRLFGEEPGEAEAIALMTDTDNTGESAVAWYGEISLSSEEP